MGQALELEPCEDVGAWIYKPRTQVFDPFWSNIWHFPPRNGTKSRFWTYVRREIDGNQWT